MRKTRVTNLRFIHFRLGVFLENSAHSLFRRLWHKAWGVRPVKRATAYGLTPVSQAGYLAGHLVGFSPEFRRRFPQAVRRAHFASLILGLALGFG